MSELRKYNTDALFIFPLIGDGVQDFINDYTPAAGDAKVWTDKLISTNPTALILGFDSLSELPVQGATIDEQGAGTASGVVAFTVVISGTVSGGDAAGFFFMRSVTGQAWSNNDVIDINGGTTNIADADSTTYDLAATAGLIADMGNGQYAAALSPTEMTCAQGSIHIVDSATKAIEDQAIEFTTFGNASALLAVDFDDAVRGGLTALPNANADAAGGLVISDAGGHDPDLMALAVGLENDAAAVGDPSTSESAIQYLKQLVNVIIGTTGVGTMPSGLDPANGVNLFEMLRAAMGSTFATATDSLEQLQIDIVAVQSDTDDLQTQIGTAGAGLSDLGGMSTGMKNEVNAEADTAATDYGALKPTVGGRTLDVTGTGAGGIDWANVENPTTALDLSGTDIQLVDTCTTNTDVRGTDNAFLASVGGVLADAAAAGEVTTADTLVQYIKQLINILIGGPGIVTFPAEAAPGNAVSLAEVIRAIHVDTTKFVFTVANQVDSNIISISGDSTAADRLEALMDGGIIGQVNDASATTTAFAADGFTEATDDHFKGRLITFVSGALNGQQTDITGYDAAGGTQGSQEFTVTATTEAPANDDFFVVH